MKNKHLEKAMVSVLDEMNLGPDTPWHIEPFNVNLWISSMYRVTIQPPDSREVSLFVKRLPENIHLFKTFESPIYFINEAAAYKEVFHTFNEFQKEQGLQDPIQFVPRCYYSECDGKNDTIILQDLTSEGYSLPSPVKGLNFGELKTLMTSLGQYHALSLAMKFKQPQRFKKLSTAVKETIWSSGHFERVSKEPFTQSAVSVYTLLAENGSEYLQILKPFATRCAECLKETSVYDPENEPWNVITHGDLWPKNLLFTSPPNQKVRFIDFQHCRYGSPAFDLSSVLYLCMYPAVRVAHREELLQLYHQSLSHLLVQLGLDPQFIFPYSQVEKQLKKYGKYALGISFMNLPHAMHISTNEDPEVSATVTMDDVLENECKNMNPACLQRIADNIKDAVTRGYLN